MPRGSGPARAAVALVVALLVGVLAGACSVREPDTADWRELARTSLSDAASDVATLHLTLQSVRDGEIWSSYAVTVAAEAEKALGIAEESLSSVQPPAGRHDDTEDLLGMLDRAMDAVRAGRADLVAGTDVDAAVIRRLGRLATALEDRASEL